MVRARLCWARRLVGCVAAKATEHPLKFIDFRDEALGVWFGNQTKIASQPNLCVEFVRRAKGDGQKAPELLV